MGDVQLCEYGAIKMLYFNINILFNITFNNVNYEQVKHDSSRI